MPPIHWWRSEKINGQTSKLNVNEKTENGDSLADLLYVIYNLAKQNNDKDKSYCVDIV